MTNVHYYFNLWRKKVHQKRTHRLFGRRLGIDVQECSNRNYANLLQRLKTLSSPMSKLMKAHLSCLERNINGLSSEEQILYTRLFRSDWWLLHRFKKETHEKIMESDRKSLLSLEELLRQSLIEGSPSQFEYEILDGIFFTISPGEAEGHAWRGDYKVKINLRKVSPLAIEGLFVSGCMSAFADNLKHRIAVLYGSNFYMTSDKEYNETQGLLLKKDYCFECDGETVVHTVDRTQELYTSQIIEALCYTVIERVRQLGKTAWTLIYQNISNVSLEELQELAKNLLPMACIEAHIPREINISQSGIYVTQEQTTNTGIDTDRLLIENSYKGNIEFLQSVSRPILLDANFIIKGNRYDVLTAAILGGHIKTIEYLLSIGISIEEPIKSEELYEQCDKPYLIIYILSVMMGFKQPETQATDSSRIAEIVFLEESIVAPQLNKQEKQKFALEVLKRLVGTGSINQKNQSIHYLFPYGLYYSDVNKIPENFSEAFNTSFSGESLEARFIQILKENKILAQTAPQPITLSNSLKISIILFGENSETQKPWCLFEYGNGAGYTGLRANRNLLELLEKDIYYDYSEQELVGRIVSEYYALSPKSIQQLENSPLITTEKTTYIIKIIDPVQNDRLQQEFKEQIVFLDDIIENDTQNEPENSMIEIKQKQISWTSIREIKKILSSIRSIMSQSRVKSF